MSDSRRRRAEHIRRLMAAEGASIREQSSRLNRNRIDATADFAETEALRDRAREIKADAIADLPALIDRVTAAVEDGGGHVYLADDAADATDYVEAVAADRDAETVVKSKSMTTEEIGLGDALEAAGVDVWETDLGEFVLQVADEAPSHIVGPAMHKSRAEIARLFNAHFDPEEPLETADELTAFARDFLGERVREADLGITGANFVLAESGTVVLVTNEGNARKTAVTPDAHVAVAGVEKLLPSVEQLQPFVELIARSATGQPISRYLSLFSGATDSPTLDFDRPDDPLGSGDRDRAFHLVLVDNGRTAMREDDDLRETLYCIRCGACSNSCANFQAVGGHAFGGDTYSGGIATGWEAGVHGTDSAAEFNDLCTGCSRCVPACPVKIDVPWINTAIRDRLNRGADPGAFDFLVDGLAPDEEPAGLDPQKRLFGNLGTLATIGSATAPVSNWLADSTPVRLALDRLFGIDPRRDLPEFRRETLVDWAADRHAGAGPEPDQEVVVYPDVYTNHVHVERGKAAVRALEALGVGVVVPALPESGRAPLSQGMVGTARGQAAALADALAPHLDAGRDVVVLEPSDLAMVRREYERLVPDGTADRLSGATYDFAEYVYGLLANGADTGPLPSAAAGHTGSAGDAGVVYHGHCQGRTLGIDAYVEAVLDELGYDVIASDVECCGMAGSFGYKAEYYDLSVDVGEQLADWIRDHPDRTVVAGGASCHEQLDALLDRPVSYPAELIAPVPDGRPGDA